MEKVPSTLQEAKIALIAFLRQHQCKQALLISQVLLIHTLNISKVDFITQNNMYISSEHWDDILILANRYITGEPLAYIIGYKEFYSRDFIVNPNTLIPRPESEDMLEAIFKRLPNSYFTFADIGTGTGCLGISIALECSKSKGFLLDKSPLALEIAVRNIQKFNIGNRIQSLLGDLCLLPLLPNSLDLFISNPPYISEKEFKTLDSNVKDFEPKMALVPNSKDDAFGLQYLEQIAKQSFNLLKDKGICAVEHGYTQGEQVRKLFAKYGTWKSIETRQDLAGLDRFCIATR